jgi:hypothetical protein
MARREELGVSQFELGQSRAAGTAMTAAHEPFTLSPIVVLP